MSSQFDEGVGQSEGMNPLAFVVPVIILAIVVTVIARRRNNNALDAVGDGARRVTRKGGSGTRRLMIGVLINALENDLARRAVIMGLKIARSRM